MFIPKPTPLSEALSLIRAQDAVHLSAESIEDPVYREIATPIIQLALLPVYDFLPEGRYCIAGGVARAVFNNEVPEDVDIFLLGDSTTIENNLTNLATIINPNSLNCFSKDSGIKQYSIKYTDFVKQIRILEYNVSDQYIIQFIGQWFESPTVNSNICFTRAEDVLETFDIVSACFAIELEIHPFKIMEVNKIISHPLCMQCIATKELRVSELGTVSWKRMRADRFYKYITEYGFRVKTAEHMKAFNTLLSNGIQDAEFDYS